MKGRESESSTYTALNKHAEDRRPGGVCTIEEAPEGRAKYAVKGKKSNQLYPSPGVDSVSCSSAVGGNGISNT